MHDIGETLKALRSSNKLSAEDVVSRLKDRGIPISAKTLYGYENGQPVRSSTFLALCEIYSVKNVISTFLSSIPSSKSDWDKGDYEDYFNGRTVNEKFGLLSEHGIPSFDGYEKEKSSDVFFGLTASTDSFSDFEWEVIRRLRRLPKDQQQAFLLILSGTKTPEP